jgi:Asp-tRNA(Asn)/Glu-tRNA(Gln) amidotransferase A subunit family amidase
MPATQSTETLCYTSAVELARQIQSREISPVELTDAFLARIDEINPKLNAYVTVLHDQAREQAKIAEAALMKGQSHGPLHGLPISIKDLALTKGVRTTGGSRAYEHRVPDENSPVVERLLGAGAINLGKTNTPEFGWLAITDNEIFGRTSNPWDLERTSSGSSGGAAAAVAAGLAAISHGSDGGGSIRHPASFCGVFGIKPTYGMIPRHPGVDGWPTLSHQGPLTRTVADGALAMDVMCGYDARDMMSAPIPPQNFLANLGRNLKGVRVAWSADLGHAEVDPEVRALFEQSIAAFTELGCEVRPGHPDLRAAREIFKMVMFSELAASDLKHIAPDGTSKMNPELTRFVLKRKDILARDYLAAMEDRAKMYAGVADFFRATDILLTPTMAIPPFKHPRTMSEYPHTVNGVEVGSTGWHPFTYPFNLTGQPAATVPCGWTRDGLPVGLQIIGRRYEDLLVMQVAAGFERARPWSSRRPKL